MDDESFDAVSLGEDVEHERSQGLDHLAVTGCCLGDFAGMAGVRDHPFPAYGHDIFGGRRNFFYRNVDPLPGEINAMHKIQQTYTVLSNKKVCPRYYHLSLDGGKLPQNIYPGQFVHIRVREGLEPFFRRPFSVFRARKTVDILYDVVGQGTEILSSKGKGDRLDVLGPLGNHFALPDKNIRQVVMIAGGIGVAPFLIFSDYLKSHKAEKTLLYGGRTKAHVFDFKPFVRNGCDVHVATEDGGAGIKGRVSRLFSKIRKDPESTVIYTCGPKPMMAAVQDFARKHRLPGQASCEEVMACGLGACLGCSTKTHSGYKTVCYDGPVFDLQEICF